MDGFKKGVYAFFWHVVRYGMAEIKAVARIEKIVITQNINFWYLNVDFYMQW